MKHYIDMKELYLNYGYTPDKEAIDRSLELIASNLENLVSDSVIKECFSLMDLTSLHNADSVDSITKLMEKVNTYRDIYPGYPLPASVCVYPNLAHVVKECRKEEAVHVTAVAGCFPTSQSFIEVKTKECEMAVEAGADEIDIDWLSMLSWWGIMRPLRRKSVHAERLLMLQVSVSAVRSCSR